MSTVLAARRHVKGVRFHPTDTELITYLKKFFKSERFSSQCPIQFADIYGDQPPWEIFGTSEEKVRYYITPLKKRKSEHIRYCRTCANGTWKGQTSEYPIRDRKRTVVGFGRNFTFQTKEREQNKTWLMKEYFVADDFFSENNIPKEDYVISRIKKKVKDKKVKDNGATYNMEEQYVAGIIKVMLHEPADDHYCTTKPTEDQVMEETDQWDSIIDEVCDQQADEVENTTFNTTMENQNTTWSSTTLEQEAYAQPLIGIEQVQGDGANHENDIESGGFWETISGILGDATIDISDYL
ncbi:NAC domain-containing protein 78-like [Lycium barbarum]|uniref:NAC domain-containing protein 78-like n=1 Tax=Lycium barbarum TaxID=112863 RepID=UPI00293E6789|nr:NAC domain-containing protein 78-like [Lycium barbarum]